MNISQAPSKFPLIFGFSATPGVYVTEPIPTPAQTGANDGRASLTTGFPPRTFTDPAAGGTWPDGRDMNGILYMLSASAQWDQAGGPWTYDVSFSTSIGGYPFGAILESATIDGAAWLNNVNNNGNNPDTTGVGGGWWPIVRITSSNRANASLSAVYEAGGNPNGALAGSAGNNSNWAPDLVYDFAHNQYMVCVVTGAAGAAIFYNIAAGNNPANSVLISGGPGPISSAGPSPQPGAVLTSNGTAAPPTFQTGTHGTAAYRSAGTFNFTVPSNVYWIFIRVWGGGGGGSGGSGGGGGGGGGYAEGWVSVFPGENITVVVGGGGAPASSGGTAGTGGTSAMGPIAATGGYGSNVTPGGGGADGGGPITGPYGASGGASPQLDGSLSASPGGAGAGGGGAGGVMDQGGNALGAKPPGGGGAANSFVAMGSAGADGSVVVTW